MKCDKNTEVFYLVNYCFCVIIIIIIVISISFNIYIIHYRQQQTFTITLYYLRLNESQQKNNVCIKNILLYYYMCI